MDFTYSLLCSSLIDEIGLESCRLSEGEDMLPVFGSPALSEPIIIYF